ncbi:hypothetical protein [Tateyamaria pelophila]|uniref:hypothetical protein n=1 Tax=Tateyamaria pelophila TaxID=328415 RepID=UPI001CBF54CC|nr:hypothetical protein [Tateyamaria pelophila]
MVDPVLSLACVPRLVMSEARAVSVGDSFALDRRSVFFLAGLAARLAIMERA